MDVVRSVEGVNNTNCHIMSSGFVFPGGMARARIARAAGQAIIGATGNAYDPIENVELHGDGKQIRLADLMGVEGEDVDDDGPPIAARYITRRTHPYRLPSVELQRHLIYHPEAFRRYLTDAL